YFKRVYRREFELAFREAVQSLSDRERILVRQHFLDGVSVNDLGRLYRVHRATAGRWLERARDALLAATRARLMARLAVPAAPRRGPRARPGEHPARGAAPARARPAPDVPRGVKPRPPAHGRSPMRSNGATNTKRSIASSR